MSVDILRISWDQCVSMVQYCFTFTETMRLVRTDSPGRPPRLSHSSWTMNTGALGLVLFQIFTLSVDYLLELRKRTRRRDWTSFGYTSRFSYNYIYRKTIRHLLQETSKQKKQQQALSQCRPVLADLLTNHLLQMITPSGLPCESHSILSLTATRTKTWILSAKHEEQINNICLVSAPDASNSCGVV